MFTMTKRLKRSTWVPVTAFAAALMLAACGSGGGSSSSTTTPVTPTDPTVKTSVEGYWSGCLNFTPCTDPRVTVAMTGPVLDSGEYWFLLSTVSDGRVFALVHGTGQSASYKFSSTNAKYFPQAISQGAVASTSGTLGSTTAYTIDTSFPGNTSFTFPGAKLEPSFFLTFESAYNTAVTTSQIEGTWLGANQAISYDSDLFNFVVSSNGSFTLTYRSDVTGASQPGCTATGTISPRPGGKRVYNVTMTYGASPCALPNAVFNGIAQPTYKQTTGVQRLIMTAIDSTNSYDFIGVIDRPN